MLKKIVCLTALVLVFAGLAAAQATKITPTVTTREQFLVPPQPGVLKSPFNLLPRSAPLQPTYCSPCLFYGGDSVYNPLNGLYSGNTFASATVYVPFTIPTKPKSDWSITGVFGNIEYYPSTAVFGTGNGPFATDVLWSISTGLVAGFPPPAPICSGTTTYGDNGASELTFTGRIFFGFYGEYTTPVTISGCPTLEENTKGSLYWLTVVPECNTPACPANALTGSNFEVSYLSDAEPGLPPCSGIAPPEAFGPPEPCDASYFYSPFFGFPNLAPTGGSPTAVCGTFGCDMFSAGVEGTVVK